MSLRDVINSINDRKVLKLLKRMDSNDVLCFLMSLNILMSATGFTPINNNKNNNNSSVSNSEKNNSESMDPSFMPSVMAPLFSYDSLSISEKQTYLEETYGINYMDLVKASTVKEYGIDYSGADQLKARSDYTEIKELFDMLVQEKLDYVLTKYNLSFEQFEIVVKTLLGEGGEYDYDECYKLANSVDNRIHSSKWVNSVSKWFNDGDGYSLYYQIICPGQYAVYLDGIYKKYGDVFDYIGTFGIMDYLFKREPVTDDMSFYMGKNGGNVYHDPLTDNLRIDNPMILDEEEVKLVLKK